MTPAERLKALRKDRGLSLRKLAAITGISNPYLSQLENGRTDILDMSFRRLLRLTATLHTTVEHLAFGVKENA